MEVIEFDVTAHDVEQGQEVVEEIRRLTPIVPPNIYLSASCAVARAASRKLDAPCEVAWDGSDRPYVKVPPGVLGQYEMHPYLRIKGDDNGAPLRKWLRRHDEGKRIDPITVEAY